MFIILLLTALFLFLFSYELFGKNIIHPGVIIPGLFFIQLLFSLSLFDYWNLIDYSFQASFLFILSLVSYVLGSYFATRLFFVDWKKNKHSDLRTYHNELIHIPQIHGILLLFICLLLFLLFAVYYKNNVNGESLPEMISFYKSKYRGITGDPIPVYIKVITRVIQAITLFLILIAINNRILGDKKGQVILVFPSIFYISLCILTANRLEILSFIMAIVYFGFFCFQRKSSLNRESISKVIIGKSLVFLLVVFTFFVFSTQLMGTVGDLKNFDFRLYICNYFCGPISSFDLYLKQGGAKVKWFGEETFVTMNNNLASILKLKYGSSRILEFRFGNGYSVPNIYSAVRRFYHDFGIVGVIILPLVQGFVFSKVYSILKSKPNNLNFVSFVFCLYIHSLFYMLIEDTFYTVDVSISGFVQFIMFSIIYFYFSVVVRRQYLD